MAGTGILPLKRFPYHAFQLERGVMKPLPWRATPRAPERRRFGAWGGTRLAISPGCQLDANRPRSRHHWPTLREISNMPHPQEILWDRGMRLLFLGRFAPAERHPHLPYNEGHSPSWPGRIRWPWWSTVCHLPWQGNDDARNISPHILPCPPDRSLCPYLMDHYFTAIVSNSVLGAGILAAWAVVAASEAELFHGRAGLVWQPRRTRSANCNGHVARNMWKELWPGTPGRNIPITQSLRIHRVPGSLVI